MAPAQVGLDLLNPSRVDLQRFAAACLGVRHDTRNLCSDMPDMQCGRAVCTMRIVQHRVQERLVIFPHCGACGECQTAVCTGQCSFDPDHHLCFYQSNYLAIDV
jgi:hypothetical protein